MAAKARPKRLILLLDGTWNDAEGGEKDTNIVRLRDLLAEALTASFYVRVDIDEVIANDGAESDLAVVSTEGIDHVFFYERGVGTGPGLDRVRGGALGRGLDRNIRRAYRFLSREFA